MALVDDGQFLCYAWLESYTQPNIESYTQPNVVYCVKYIDLVPIAPLPSALSLAICALAFSTIRIGARPVFFAICVTWAHDFCYTGPVTLVHTQ